MHRAAMGIAAVLVALAAPSRASAQTVGTIAGHVVDTTGVPIRGVSVVASSRTQIGGPKRATTDDQGRFRIPGLTPGQFTVTASAPKLKSVVLETIRVTQGATAEIDIVLEVETTEEQVKVVDRAPVVNTTTAAVGDTFDPDFVNSLPLQSRSYQGVMALTPGVLDLDGTGNPTVRGGTYFNNTYTVDGFQTTDPVTHTFGQNFSFDAIANIEVQTAALDPEYSTTIGAVTNTVTKSGSNRLEVDGTLAYRPSWLELFRDERDRGGSRIATASVNAGGPILKDRLWFYASVQGTTNKLRLDADPAFPDHPPLSILALDPIVKLTLQITPRNKVEFKANWSPAEFQNILQDYRTEPEAEARRFQNARGLQLSWHAVLTGDLILIVRAGLHQSFIETGPQSCKWDPEGCHDVAGEIDRATSVLRKNYVSHVRDRRQTVEIGSRLEWYFDTRRFGAHGLKLGGKFFGLANEAAHTVPGNSVLEFAGNQPTARTEACSNDPKLANGDCRHDWQYTEVGGQSFLAYLLDEFKPTRYLKISPAIALHAAGSHNDKDVVVTDILTLTPQIQAVWDPTHDGRTALRASFRNAVDTGFLSLARFTSRQLYEKRCEWDPDAQAFIRNCRSSGGNDATSVGLPCGKDGVNPDGSSCQTKLRAPRLWEYTVGGEREILTGISLGLDVIYRKFAHQWEDLETNALWNKSGTGFERGGSWKNGRAEFVFDLETPDEAQRTYKSMTVFLRKREGLAKALMSYTWSRYEGVEDSTYASLYLDNPGQAPYYHGPLAGDIRHDVRLLVTYQLRSWLSVGGTYKFLSGGPYNRFYFDPVYGDFLQFQARRGYDTRGNLNPDDDAPLRLPDISTLDLQARVSLRPLLKLPIELWADLFNVLALRTTTSVWEQDGPFFGRPTSRLRPMNLRVGMRAKF